MPECWLRTNRRAFLAALALPGSAVLLGILLAAAKWSYGGPIWLIVAAVVLFAAGLLGTIGLILQSARPRLAYENGALLVYLRRQAPEKVPIEIVECFFLGRAPSLVGTERGRQRPTASIVVRLAEKAIQWRQRDVDPMFGNWCDGYITIRGTWCEPISEGLLRRLNKRLSEAQRATPRDESKHTVDEPTA